LIKPFDDREHAPYVVGIVGNNQGVRRFVRRELAGRRHQRAQQRHHLGRRNVLQNRNVRGDTLAAARDIFLHVRALATFGQRDNPHQSARPVDRGETLRFECRQENVVGCRARHGFGGNNSNLSLHARIEQEIAPGHLRNRFHYGLNIGRLKI